ncbi:MAG: hypothetical protein IJN29_05650 [Akkermansia sp.]|nr:hypothetical protein [Akkermansia sp.]
MSPSALSAAPLALLLLWANEAAQAAGCETWWLASTSPAAEYKTPEQVHNLLSSLRNI